MDFNNILENLKAEGNLRTLPNETPEGFIDFTSNDYLGLASDPALAREFLESLSEFRFSTSSSRLLASCQESFIRLESYLESIYGRPVLLFNSGYHANTGIISSVASEGKCLVIADKLVHASIIDGIILSRADFRRFSHNDMDGLRKILEANKDKYDSFLVISESVFSMDGDDAPLDELLQIKKEFPGVILYLDEAHALGVRGPEGKGRAQESGSPAEWDIIVAPMGKAAASMGAFAVCSKELKDFLVNRSRSLIFSTALPPIQMQWSLFILKKMFEAEERRKHLKKLSLRLSNILREIFNQQNPTYSHIQPLIIGDSRKAVKMSERIYESGIKVLPIRKPTVPKGTERLRFSLTADMSEEDIDKLGTVLAEIKCRGDIL